VNDRGSYVRPTWTGDAIGRLVGKRKAILADTFSEADAVLLCLRLWMAVPARVGAEIPLWRRLGRPQPK
jgi:hypothetical protein